MSSDSNSADANVSMQMREVANAEYELIDADGRTIAGCEPGDRIYVKPYVYVCQGGRWVRLPAGME